MKRSDAMFKIVRAAYEAADEVDEEHRGEFSRLAVELDNKACDLRDAEAEADAAA